MCAHTKIHKVGTSVQINFPLLELATNLGDMEIDYIKRKKLPSLSHRCHLSAILFRTDLLRDAASYLSFRVPMCGRIVISPLGIKSRSSNLLCQVPAVLNSGNKEGCG